MVGVFIVITAQRRQDFRITPPRSPGASQGGHFLPCRYEPLAFASLKATWEAGPWPLASCSCPLFQLGALGLCASPSVTPGLPQRCENCGFGFPLPVCEQKASLASTLCGAEKEQRLNNTLMWVFTDIIEDEGAG